MGKGGLLPAKLLSTCGKTETSEHEGALDDAEIGAKIRILPVSARGVVARSKVLAFVQAPVEKLTCGSTRGAESAATQIKRPLARRKNDERKAQEARISSSGPPMPRRSRRQPNRRKECENRKEERLPTVTIASGLFRTVAPPFKKRRATNGVPVEAPVAARARRCGGVWIGAFKLWQAEETADKVLKV